MNLRKKDIFIMIVIMFAVGFLGAYTGLKVFQPELSSNGDISSSIPMDELEPQMDRIQQAYTLIDENFVGEIKDGQLMEGAIQGMLDTLDDPYSSYMNEDAMEHFQEQITSSFQGIGAEVSMVEGKVTVVAPIKDSPAEKAGIRPNDQILKVNDTKLEGMDLNEAVQHIRGEKGSEVVLLIQRKGASDPFEMTLVRDDIPIETVHAETTEIDGKKTGILEISTFSETTSEEFQESLNVMEQEGIEGLVIDVRGNPGGLLDAVEEIMDLFIPKDIPYVQTEDREGNRQKFFSELEEKKPYPINILINEGSASASEILAVALKEVGYDTVGDTSFGKGTVQKAVPMDKDGGGMIKLTYYKWLSPEGNWIHEKGVTPTVEVNQPDFYFANPIQIEKPLQYDQTGEQIKNAQIMLSGIGFDTGRKDGYFDEETMKAVKEFQKKHKLEPTGEIDEKTAADIESEVIQIIRSGEKDVQMEKALQVLYK